MRRAALPQRARRAIACGLAALPIALAIGIGTGSAAAQAAQPSGKPVRVIVPYGAGGLIDAGVRIVTSHMATTLNAPIVVENKPGANANIGAAAGAQAPADGHTLLATAAYFTTNPVVESGLRWSPEQLAPLARFALSPSVVVVSAASPYRSLQELLLAAHAAGKVSAGESGPGASQTMVKDLLADSAGVSFLTVQYAQGGTSYVTDLLNGDVTMGVIPINVGLGLVQGGRARALAITSQARLPMLPDTPTMAEAGYPDASIDSWIGFHVPAGTPPEAVRRLAGAVQAATQDDGVRQRLATAGAQAAFLDTPSFTAFLRQDQQRAHRFMKLRQSQSQSQSERPRPGPGPTPKLSANANANVR